MIPSRYCSLSYQSIPSEQPPTTEMATPLSRLVPFSLIKARHWFNPVLRFHKSRRHKIHSPSSYHKQPMNPYSNPPSTSHKRPVPWWNPELKQAIKQRKSALKTLTKINTLTNLIQFKKMRANAGRLPRLSKKRSWEEFVASIDHPVSCSVMWSQMRKLKGHSQSFTIQMLL